MSGAGGEGTCEALGGCSIQFSAWAASNPSTKVTAQLCDANAMQPPEGDHATECSHPGAAQAREAQERGAGQLGRCAARFAGADSSRLGG